MRHVAANREFYTDYAKFTKNLMNLIDYPHVTQSFHSLVPTCTT